MDGLGIIIDGRDITEDVSVFSGVVDLCLSDLADSASITLQDADQRWGDWAPESGLPVRLTWNGVQILDGALTSASASNGLYALEIDTAAARKFRRFSLTCEGTLKDALSRIAQELGLAAKFTGDFSADVSGVWRESSTGGEMIRALRDLFCFDFVGDRSALRFISADAIAEGAASFSWGEDPGGDFGFTAPPAAHGVTVINGQSSAAAGDGADIIRAVGVPSASLQQIADSVTAQRTRARASIRIDAGELWIPGAIADLDSVAEPFRGRWLIRSCRLDIAQRRQTVGLASLDIHG